VIDDLIDKPSQPHRQLSQRSVPLEPGSLLAGLDCHKKAETTELAVPINRGQYRRESQKI
jgi:hypothetical protein